MKTDSQLQRDVMKELEWEPRIDAAHIGVAAKDGVITLSGSVPSYGEKYDGGLSQWQIETMVCNIAPATGFAPTRG